MNPKKISRICWNTNNWVKPSGKEGKSKNVDKNGEKAFEYENGFGHEEWLFDLEKEINGWHYSFLQSINHFRCKTGKYIGEVFDISLYTINSKTKEKFWIGEIHNVHVIGFDESIEILNTYKQNKWYDEMTEDLKNVDATYTELININEKDFFNIKFKIDDVDLLEEPQLISEEDTAISSFYYILINKISEPLLVDYSDGNFRFKPGINPKKQTTYKQFQKSFKVINLEHNITQVLLYNHLCDIYGPDSVGTENPTGYGARIDVVVKNVDKIIFYELKTGYDLLSNIRVALTQLLEYCFYPNKKNADELIIVSLLPTNKKIDSYLRLLSDKIGIPIYYKQFDKIKNILI